MLNERNRKGDLIANPQRFPMGIKRLADKIHNMGFQFGIYESAGAVTCMGLPGSLSIPPPFSPQPPPRSPCP